MSERTLASLAAEVRTHSHSSPEDPLKVTIASPPDALQQSQAAATIPDPLSWSFWIAGCKRKLTAGALPRRGFAVVHQRLGHAQSDEAQHYWQDSFVARSSQHVSSTMLALAKALEIAVDHCERKSGAPVTIGRIKMGGMAERLKQESVAIRWPMPNEINIFMDNARVIQSFESCWKSDSLTKASGMRAVGILIEALNQLNVKVRIQWVPDDGTDERNRWAHAGARLALAPKTMYGRKVRTRKTHRVSRRALKTMTRSELPTGSLRHAGIDDQVTMTTRKRDTSKIL